MRAVAAYKPFPPAIALHERFGHDFWVAAVAMCSHSVSRACGCPLDILTDAPDALPFESLPMTMPLVFPTTEQRHMLWALDACVHYLGSRDFDQDTAALDCDVLVYRDLAPLFAGDYDLGVVVRQTPKRGEQAILNGLQLWPLRSREKLQAFYGRALALARTLGEDSIGWGADTDILCHLLAPVSRGLVAERAGLTVRFFSDTDVLATLSSANIAALQAGRFRAPRQHALDFRHARKAYMRDAYEATLT